MIHRINRHVKKALRAVICLAACTAVLSGCGKSTQYTASGLVMDTVFTVTVYGDKDMPAQLIELGNELDKSVLSRFSDDSLLSRYYEDVSGSITDSPGDPAAGSNEIYEILKKCDEIRKDSNNLFDVHMGALSDLWNISGKARGETEPIVPEPEDILSAKEDRTILDLGAVGKGIYLDHAYELLKQSDVSCAVISAGGSVMTYGRKPDDTDFNVAIRNPFPDAENESYGTIVLRGTNFVSTSGSYERYFEKDGVRYHHILNFQSSYCLAYRFLQLILQLELMPQVYLKTLRQGLRPFLA